MTDHPRYHPIINRLHARVLEDALCRGPAPGIARYWAERKPATVVPMSGPRPLTRNDILALSVGDVLDHTMDTRDGIAAAGARYSEPRTVVELFAKGISPYTGLAYTCGYTTFAVSSRISFSIVEGEECFRLVSTVANTHPKALADTVNGI